MTVHMLEVRGQKKMSNYKDLVSLGLVAISATNGVSVDPPALAGKQIDSRASAHNSSFGPRGVKSRSEVVRRIEGERVVLPGDVAKEDFVATVLESAQEALLTFKQRHPQETA